MLALYMVLSLPGDSKRVDELLKRSNVDVSQSEVATLSYARQLSQVNGVFAGHTALQAAAQNGHAEIARSLLEHNGNTEIEVGSNNYKNLPQTDSNLPFRTKMAIVQSIMQPSATKWKFWNCWPRRALISMPEINDDKQRYTLVRLLRCDRQIASSSDRSLYHPLSRPTSSSRIHGTEQNSLPLFQVFAKAISAYAKDC